MCKSPLLGQSSTPATAMLADLTCGVLLASADQYTSYPHRSDGIPAAQAPSPVLMQTSAGGPLPSAVLLQTTPAGGAQV